MPWRLMIWGQWPQKPDISKEHLCKKGQKKGVPRNESSEPRQGSLSYSEGGWGRTHNCDPTSHGEGARLVPNPTQPCNKDLGANNLFVGLPQWLSGKESACGTGATGDTGLIPGSGRSSEEGRGNPLQYSCLETPLDQKSLTDYSS